MANPTRPWQRQPGEAPADFTAFISYLRLKGRRSHHLVATRTARSLGAIRRLATQFKWRTRIAAFEARLADSSQDALDLLVRSTATHSAADFQQLRLAEFELSQRVLAESHRWLQLASDPRRREVSLPQLCRVIELATELGRLAVGMPAAPQPGHLRREDTPGYWTGPSVEEALDKIYGSPATPLAAEPAPAQSAAPSSAISAAASLPLSSPAPSPPEAPPLSPAPAQVLLSPYPRRDVWAAWARVQRPSPR